MFTASPDIITLKNLIEAHNHQGLRQLLSEKPHLANAEIPFDKKNPVTAHPLHRICDAVFAGILTDKEAAEVAKIFLEHGSNVNGFGLTENKDSPLTAAASLLADEVALLYIEQGADIRHPGCHGGTALHWAAWCGRDKLVKVLLQKNAEVNRRCIDFKSTPLFWGIHGFKNGGNENRQHYTECVRMLIHADADKSIPNAEGKKPIDLLEKDDADLYDLLK